MKKGKILKNIRRFTTAFTFATAAVGVLNLALSKYEEKQGDYSREFAEIEDEIKSVIDEVREDYEEEI